jgi:hypothetical protein
MDFVLMIDERQLVGGGAEIKLYRSEPNSSLGSVRSEDLLLL